MVKLANVKLAAFELDISSENELPIPLSEVAPLNLGYGC